MRTAAVFRHTDFNVPIFANDIFVIIADLQNELQSLFKLEMMVF